LDIKAENFVIALQEDQRTLKVDPFSFKLIDFNTSVLGTDHVKANTASITKIIKAPEIRKKSKNYVIFILNSKILNFLSNIFLFKNYLFK